MNAAQASIFANTQKHTRDSILLIVRRERTFSLMERRKKSVRNAERGEGRGTGVMMRGMDMARRGGSTGGRGEITVERGERRVTVRNVTVMRATSDVGTDIVKRGMSGLEE